MLLLIGFVDFKEEKKNFSGGEHSRVPLEKNKTYSIKGVTDSFRNSNILKSINDSKINETPSYAEFYG